MKFEFSAPGRIVFRSRLGARGGLRGRFGRPAGPCDHGRPFTRSAALQLARGGRHRLGYFCDREGASIRGRPRRHRPGPSLGLRRGDRIRRGSALDLAKAVAALLANPGDPLDYAEVIGGGKALSEPSYPCIAIPTTAGTGSEATRNAVLASPENGVKASLRSPTMLPRLAIVDPELSYGLPPRITAETGMDALAQLLEPLVCSGPNPLVDAICREALPRAIESLPRAYRDGSDEDARESMAYASLCGGMALANARLGAVHGFASPLGGAFPIPHGAACAVLLAPVAAANVAALRAREPAAPRPLCVTPRRPAC